MASLRRTLDGDLAAAERAGLRLAVTGRTLALVPVMLWFLLAGQFPSNLMGAALASAFVGLGLLHLRLIGSPRERGWHRYAFVTVDVAALGAVVAFVPLSIGGEVPQIVALRAYGVHYAFVFLAGAALSLSPGLVLWAGAAIVAMIWTVFLWLVAGMERTVSWGDMPVGPTAEQYLAVFLDPDFIGTGNRIEESIVILLTAAILAAAVHRARRLVRERVRIQRVFGQYVPPQVAEAILADEAALAPQTRTASILFADIEGFTSLSEARPPAEVIAMLNGYFAAATDLVTAEGGVVISFAGDAVIAAFNLPLTLAQPEEAAVRAGRGLLALAAERRFEGVALRLRVGIATGPVAAGSVGGGERQTYTVYGDTVNLAQRLEALNKQLGTRLLVCAATREGAGPGKGVEGAFREAGLVTVRGRAAPVRVFTLES